MLEESKKLYEQASTVIKNFKELSNRELADLYLETKEERLKDGYFACLMLRYWNYIYKLTQKSLSLRIDEDVRLNWLEDGLVTALKYHPWTDKNSKFYSLPKIVNTCVYQCASTNMLQAYRESNYDKNVINHKYILDAPTEDRKSLIDTVVDEDSEYRDKDIRKLVVQPLFDRERYLEGIIVELLAYGDTWVRKSKSYTYVAEEKDKRGNDKVKKIVTPKFDFSVSKLIELIHKVTYVQFLNMLNEYEIKNTMIFELQLKMLKNANSTLLTKTINNTLNYLRTSDLITSLVEDFR